MAHAKWPAHDLCSTDLRWTAIVRLEIAKARFAWQSRAVCTPGAAGRIVWVIALETVAPPLGVASAPGEPRADDRWD
jgi:hypothetical protein